MSIAVIADAHIDGPGGEPGPLIEQLRELGDRGCRRLILLGDLFQTWIGQSRYETAAIREVAVALAELRDQGVRIDYVEGNRDFFIGQGPYAELFDSIGDEVTVEIGGRRLLLVHGDGLNRKDRLYRFWRWFSHCPPVRLAMFHLPRRLAQRLVVGFERGLARTNFKHKTEIPEQPILEFARRRFAEGHDMLFLGHYHEPRHWRLPEGDVWLLDAWFSSHRVEWLGDEPYTGSTPA
jgi:UDP-2,3-diacylglucosamine hydrolase